jgi:acetylornithine deacetylase/succinyl-diaminopimelate desuccinylase-like protein
VEVVKNRNLLYVEADSPLIRSLKGAYETVTEESVVPLTKGGASYARVLQRGVAFGPTFPGEVPHSHFANEQLPVASLKKALAIWLLSLEELTRGE